ncbi:hypothetical protein C1H46_009153 [Malus baccata]|uniref:Uncharacterized protein n=1 Tax=Malus baccata TaxID=106549 RepID=A0A540N2D6_MALBA|nr:hypothetical protein C1H46_009153 [Malus baccata]
MELRESISNQNDFALGLTKQLLQTEGQVIEPRVLVAVHPRGAELDRCRVKGSDPGPAALVPQVRRRPQLFHRRTRLCDLLRWVHKRRPPALVCDWGLGGHASPSEAYFQRGCGHFLQDRSCSRRFQTNVSSISLLPSRFG